MDFEDILKEEKEKKQVLNEGAGTSISRFLGLRKYIPNVKSKIPDINASKGIGSGVGLMTTALMFGIPTGLALPMSLVGALFLSNDTFLRKLLFSAKNKIISKAVVLKEGLTISPNQMAALRKLEEKYPGKIYETIKELRKKYSNELAGNLKSFKNIDEEIMSYVLNFKDEEGNKIEDYLAGVKYKGFSSLADFIETQAKANAKKRVMAEQGEEIGEKYKQIKLEIMNLEFIVKKIDMFKKLGAELALIMTKNPGSDDKSILDFRRESDEFNTFIEKNGEIMDEVLKKLSNVGEYNHNGLTEQRQTVGELVDILREANAKKIQDRIDRQNKSLKDNFLSKIELNSKEEAAASLSVKELFEKVKNFYETKYDNGAKKKLVLLLKKVEKELVPMLRKNIGKEDWIELVIKPKLLHVFVNTEEISQMISKLETANKKLAASSGLSIKSIRGHALSLKKLLADTSARFRKANLSGLQLDREEAVKTFDEFTEREKSAEYNAIGDFYKDVEKAKIILKLIKENNVFDKTDIRDLQVNVMQVVHRKTGKILAQRSYIDDEEANLVVDGINKKRDITEEGNVKFANAVLTKDTSYAIATSASDAQLNVDGITDYEKKNNIIIYNKADDGNKETKEVAETEFEKAFGVYLRRNNDDKLFATRQEAFRKLTEMKNEFEETIKDAEAKLATLSKKKVKSSLLKAKGKMEKELEGENTKEEGQ
jgi:hypothetical protein